MPAEDRKLKPARAALGKRLSHASHIPTFGVKPNWGDYLAEAQESIQTAESIFYPTPLYEDIFRLTGKKTFPKNYYAFIGNKIRQTALFQLLGIAHPRTKLYYGRNRAERVAADFHYPFVAKTPLGSSKGSGVFLIEHEQALARYLKTHRPAYIQELLPIDGDLRVVLIRGRVAHAYWRIHKPGEFRNNVALGARIDCDDIPPEALDFAAQVAQRCGFDEVGLDVCCAHGRYYVLEANMVFGLEGFRQCGLNHHELLARMAIDEAEG